MNDLDIAILNHLQADAQLTNAELADKVHLSASQVSRRRGRLEQAGVVLGYKAELDANRLGLGINAFVRVTLTAHSADTAERFGQFLRSLPQVRSAYSLTGESDYLVHAQVSNLRQLSELVNRSLLPHENVHHVRSDIALDCIVENAPLDLSAVSQTVEI